jgi:hypothetical protein
MSLPDPVVGYQIQTLQFIQSAISITVAVDGVDFSISTTANVLDPVLFTLDILPADDIVSIKSYAWDFGDGYILNEPAPVREEYLFPETRFLSENCEDLFSTFECSFEPKHGTGGTLATIVPDASIASGHPVSAGIPYFSPAGLVTGDIAALEQTCSITSGILLDLGVVYTFTSEVTDMHVLLKYTWTIDSNNINSLTGLTRVFAPLYNGPFSGTPYRFFIEDTGVRVYTGYGTTSVPSATFTDPNANWTDGEWIGKTLVIIVAYPITAVGDTNKKLVLGTDCGVPDTASTWYNVTSGLGALEGTCTVTGNAVAISSVNPYYKDSVLAKNIITLTDSAGTSIKRLISDNLTDNDITLVANTNTAKAVSNGAYTFSIDTCDHFMVLASSETLYSDSMQFQSEIDPDDFISAGNYYLAFASGEIIKLLTSTPSSVADMYTVTIQRQSLYRSLYYAKNHYAGEIAVSLSTRSTRARTTDPQILTRTHMKEDRAIRHTDVFSSTYIAY